MARRYADLSIVPTLSPARARTLGRGLHAPVAFIALAGAILGPVQHLWRRTELIAPLDPNVETAAIFVGTFAAACLLGAVALRALGPDAEGATAGRPVLDAITGAGLLILAATWCARSLVECCAFEGGASAPFPATFDVVDGDYAGHGNHVVRVRFGPAGRIFSVRATSAASDAAHPGETVILPVETGRGGIQRTLLPARSLMRDDLHGA